jgi:penicillin-binding protein 1A
MSQAAARLTQPRRHVLRGVLIGGIGTLMVAVALLVGSVVWYGPQLPSLEPVTTYQPRQPLQVFTADGVEIAQFGAERRQFTPIAKMPLLMQQAVLAVEDARFYDHSGIDLKGLARAVLAQFTGGLRQGASTITQQVARTFFLSQRFTPERKIKEALLALEIERRLSKPQILELYMNQIYLGARSYGFAAAADAYFGKPLAQLSIAEAAMLAGLPQNPAYANPQTNLERATQRQRIVLARMVATGAITPEQQATARAEVLKLRSPSQQPLHAEYVAEMARRVVFERFGANAYSQGLRVITSLRAVDQQAAWGAVRRAVLGYDARQRWRGPEGQESLPPEGRPELEAAAALALKDYRDDEDLRVAIVLRVGPKELLAQLASGEQVSVRAEGLRLGQAALARGASAELAIRAGSVVRLVQLAAKPGSSASAAWQLTQWPEVQAGLVSLDPVTGRVRALVGGFDFTRQPFNHVTQARRQPGSAYKPFLYSAALEARVMPATLVNDAPFSADNGWAPQNSDGSFDGPITLRQALARSKNLVSIRVLRQVGMAAARSWGQRFGFAAADLPDNLTLALGAGSTTPMRLAQAYGVLANGGWSVTPVVIERITDAQGQLLFEAPRPLPLEGTDRAVPARNVFVTNSLLNDVTRYGTAARAQVQLGRSDLYGKTGTTNDAVDAWFAGFQAGAGNGLVAVVWMGHDEPQSLGSRESGGGLALPVWIDYMAQALKGLPVAPRPEPPDGLAWRDDDWVYAEFADGGAVAGIGLDEAALAAAEAASAASSAAIEGSGAASAAPLPASAASR